MNYKKTHGNRKILRTRNEKSKVNVKNVHELLCNADAEAEYLTRNVVDNKKNKDYFLKNGQ